MTYKRVSGSSSAYTVTSAKSIKGPGGIFISTGYEGFRFDDGSFVIQSGKLVEIGATSSPSPAPAPSGDFIKSVTIEYASGRVEVVKG